MKISRVAKAVILMVSVGGVCAVFYGLSEALFSDWRHGWRPLVVFFLFGAWAGLLMITEHLSWRRPLHAIVVAGFGFFVATALASGTKGQILATIVACAVAGYFGDLRVKHL